MIGTKHIVAACLMAGVCPLHAQDGSLDPTFNAGSGCDTLVYEIDVLPDGKILIGGQFTIYDGIPRTRIARLNPDGTLDNGFDPGTGANDIVSDCQALANGKIIVVGRFTTFNGSSINRILRVDSAGAQDGTVAGTNASTTSVALQPDGKFVIGGYFTGTPRNRIARRNADGTVDVSFAPVSGANESIQAIALQPDGKILIGGSFFTYDGVSRNRIARLNPNGTLDVSFNTGTGLNTVNCITIQPDGKILIGGHFTNYNGIPRSRIARLNPDATLDSTFDPGTGATGSPAFLAVHAIEMLPDGKILVGGNFSSFNGIPHNCITRLNQDGSVDNTFEPGTGANHTIYDLAVQENGQVLIGGFFTSYDGTPSNRIARINGTARSSIKLMLEGPYSSGQMNDALRTLPSFPLTEPFTAMGYAEAAFVPGATIPASLLSVTGNNAIVDWVLVEMRPVATPGVVAASRAVLLQRDGDVVDLDGVSTVGFAGLAAGSYCIAVKPRTHLPVMLSSSTPVIYGDAIATADFTLPSTQVYDTDALKNIGGVMVLATGDAVFNENIQYTGTNNDRDPILTRIGGSVPTATASGYWPEDVNMDGIVKYVGANNDRDPILVNVGGSTPTAVRHAELP